MERSEANFCRKTTTTKLVLRRKIKQLHQYCFLKYLSYNSERKKITHALVANEVQPESAR